MSLPNALQIFGENIVVSANLASASSGFASIGNIRDRKYNTKWQSVGSNDATQEDLVIYFLSSSGVQVAKTFDTIILLNTNMKSGYAYYYNGSEWISLPETIISNLDVPDKLFSFDAVSGDSLRFWLNTTQIANQNKYLGELKVCKHVLTLDALSQFQRQDFAKEGHYYLSGGDLVRWREFRKFGGQLTLRNISKAQRDTLWAAYEAYDFFVFAFFSEYALAETYDVAITSPPSETFDRKTQLYEMGLEVKER